MRRLPGDLIGGLTGDFNIPLARCLRHNAAMKGLDYIRVVLVQPTHPGNIGATARAMANMGVARLMLVAPRDFPSNDATARAAGAEYILTQAAVVGDLDEAIADCELVIGVSARQRAIEWQPLLPAQAMEKAVQTARHAHVALLFGRENNGLTNRELERCHYLVRIPTAPTFSSLNLAAAVMVLLYELRNAQQRADDNDADVDADVGVVAANVATDAVAERYAMAEEMQHFYQHLQQVLIRLKFTKGDSAKLHRKLTRLFNRARPFTQEIRILRGILTAVEGKIKD